MQFFLTSPQPACFSGRGLVGVVSWILAAVVLRPHLWDETWGQALLLLAAMVLFPLAFGLVAVDSWAALAQGQWRLVAAVHLPAAVLLGVAYLLDQGWMAALLALPWFAATVLVALSGLRRLWSRGFCPLHAICVDAAFVFVAVGGAWTVSDRLGFQPLGFDSVVVLLTAIHFHYAGFALPILTGWAVPHVEGPLAKVAAVGVMVAVPAVAAGITATQLGLGPHVEAVASFLMAASATLAAWLYIQLAAQASWPRATRGFWAVSGLSLFLSMVLAALYGSRFYVQMAWMDVPRMQAFHGTTNALGFALTGLLGWVWARRPLVWGKGFSGRR
jgi:hypothetical protein